MTYNQSTELREKLAKYGVEWDERNCPYYFFDTAWKYAKGAYASFTESSDGTTFLILKNVTPEQAIAATLGSERDEWKERYDSVLEGRNRWSGIVDGIYRRFYPREKYCLPIDPTDMINEAIDAIERERDEWKAKAIVATLGDERKKLDETDI